MNEVTVDQLLDTAADVLEEHEWTRYALAKKVVPPFLSLVKTNFQDPEATHFCVMGALWRAEDLLGGVSASWIAFSLVDKAAAAIWEQLPAHRSWPDARMTPRMLQVIDWNNEVAESKEEVVSALRAAARSLRQTPQWRARVETLEKG